MGRGFRRPLRRRIERFNHQVFRRFSLSLSLSKAVRLIATAREAATRIYIATRSLRKLLPLIPPAVFPHNRNIAPVEISPRNIPRPSERTFPQPGRDVKLEICARTSHLVDLVSQTMIAQDFQAILYPAFRSSNSWKSRLSLLYMEATQHLFSDLTLKRILSLFRLPRIHGCFW